MKHLYIIVAAALALCACGSPAEAPRAYDAVRTADKLEMARMTLSKVGYVGQEKPASWMDELVAFVKVGARVGVYSYRTYLRAYIDLADFRPSDVEQDAQTHTCRVRLPQPKTEFLGRDATLTEEHYRVTGLRNTISATDRAELKELMANELRREVEANPHFRKRLEEEARARAVEYFTALLQEKGWKAEVSFK